MFSIAFQKVKLILWLKKEISKKWKYLIGAANQILEHSKTNKLISMNGCIYLDDKNELKFESCKDGPNYKWIYEDEVFKPFSARLFDFI